MTRVYSERPVVGSSGSLEPAKHLQRLPDRDVRIRSVGKNLEARGFVLTQGFLQGQPVVLGRRHIFELN